MASRILLIELFIRLVTAERARSASEPHPSIPSAESDGRGELLGEDVNLVPGSLGVSGVVKSFGFFQLSSEIVQAMLVFGLGLRVQDRTSIGQESALPGTSGVVAFFQIIRAFR